LEEALDRMHPGWDDPAYLMQARKDRELRASYYPGDGAQCYISFRLLDAVRDDLRLIFENPGAVFQAEQIPAIASLARYSKEEGLETLAGDLLEIAETAPGELNRPIKLLLSIEGDPSATHTDRLKAAAGDNGSARKWCETAVLTELAWRLVEIAEPTALYYRSSREHNPPFFIERYGFELRFQLDDHGTEVPHTGVATLEVFPKEYDRLFRFALPIRHELITGITRVLGAGDASWLGPCCVLYVGRRPQRHKFTVEFEIDPAAKIDELSFDEVNNYGTGRVEFSVVYADTKKSRGIRRRKYPTAWRKELLEPEKEVLEPGIPKATMTFLPFGDNSHYFRFNIDREDFDSTDGQQFLF
jgi:hypothetical protein